jgi:hypothetical protein
MISPQEEIIPRVEEEQKMTSPKEMAVAEKQSPNQYSPFISLKKNVDNRFTKVSMNPCKTPLVFKIEKASYQRGVVFFPDGSKFISNQSKINIV